MSSNYFVGHINLIRIPTYMVALMNFLLSFAFVCCGINFCISQLYSIASWNILWGLVTFLTTEVLQLLKIFELYFRQ